MTLFAYIYRVAFHNVFRYEDRFPHQSNSQNGRRKALPLGEVDFLSGTNQRGGNKPVQEGIITRYGFLCSNKLQ